MQAFAILVYLPGLNAVLFGFLHIIHISINNAAAACRLSTVAHMFVFLSFFLFTTLALIFFQNLFEDIDEDRKRQCNQAVCFRGLEHPLIKTD